MNMANNMQEQPNQSPATTTDNSVEAKLQKIKNLLDK
jgi:hypothetical protein